MIGGFSLVQGLLPPPGTIPLGRAYATKLGTGIMGPAGEIMVQCPPYLTSCLAAVTPNGTDLQGRQLYGDSLGLSVRDSASPIITPGIDIAISCVHAAFGNPYNYQYSIADGGGTFENSYYSAFTSNMAYIDPNGNDINKRGAPYNFTIPSDRQKTRYPALTDAAIDSKMFPVFAPDNLYFLAGVTLGMLYNPGGLDPALANMHWLQIGACNSIRYLTNAGYQFLDTGDGTRDQDGLTQIKILGPDGSPLYWFVDDAELQRRSNLIHFNYDKGSQGNTSFFLDRPSVNLRKPYTEKSIHFDFYLFKMFYTDNLGNVIPNAQAFTDTGGETPLWNGTGLNPLPNQLYGWGVKGYQNFPPVPTAAGFMAAYNYDVAHNDFSYTTLDNYFTTDPVSGRSWGKPIDTTPSPGTGKPTVYFTILRQGVTYGFDVINFG